MAVISALQTVGAVSEGPVLHSCGSQYMTGIKHLKKVKMLDQKSRLPASAFPDWHPEGL